MTIKTPILGTTAIIGILAAPLAPAFAQAADDPAVTGETAPAAETQAVEYSNKQLESFVEAAVSIAEIRKQFVAEVQTAESEEAAREMQREAMENMQQAIDETENMDVETYNEIGQAYQTNEALSQKIATLMSERMPTTPPQTTDENEG